MTTIAIFGLATISKAQLPSYVPSNGLVGWWPFNGNANDESGNGNNGIVNGSSLTIDRLGNNASAYYFNGLNNYIDIASNNTINFQNEFSISVWLITNQNNFNAGIIGKWNDFNGLLQDGQEEFALTVNDGVVNTMFALLRTNTSPNTNFQVQFNNSSYNENQWNLFTYIFNNNSITLYKNNAIVGTASTTGSVINHIQNLEVGRYAGGQPTSGGNTHFNGSLDDIGIWNRALTEEELTSLYSGSPLGINETLQSNLLSVSPNPAQNQINVNTDDKLVGSVYTIYDNIGKAVKTGKLNSVNTTIELNDLSGGFYFFRVGDNLKKTFKVIKE